MIDSRKCDRYRNQGGKQLARAIKLCIIDCAINFSHTLQTRDAYADGLFYRLEVM